MMLSAKFRGSWAVFLQSRADVQMVCPSMCGPVQLSLTISWAINPPKHPRPLDSAPARAVRLTLNPSPLTFTLSPSPPSASLSAKPLLTFRQS
ncbi:hypothetical protein INR49_007863 [Caranx melampygus]|nr:hypothetical protein INR49_007863 [Caranx melampygus]